MRKVVLIFGLLSGVIISAFMLVGMMLWKDGTISMDSGELLGYSSMIIALSMIFFGIKSYRDHYQNGTIKFGKGLQVGLLITLIASVMYALTWEACYQTLPELQSSFMDKYAEQYINKMKAKGATAEEVEQQIKRMDNMKVMYKNPVLRFGITLAEILPVGIIITLLSAAALRKKERFPALETARG